LLVDRRPHIGGNAYDCHDAHGILIHRYGPHIFHTNSKEVFDYLSRFTEWRQYQHRVRASVDGMLVPMPINLDTVNALYGLNLNSQQLTQFFAERAERRESVKTSEDVIVGKVGRELYEKFFKHYKRKQWGLDPSELEQFFASVAEPIAQIRTSEDAVVSKVVRELYEKFFRGYTRKQWGLDPSELDASVTARVPTRTNRDDRYFTDTYQAMPLHGFTRMFEKMLDHPGIKILLNCDFREVRDLIPHRELIYTGPIDAFFEYKFGKLPYRSLEFRFETVNKERVQPVAVVNYPNDYAYTRVTEFKHLTGQEHPRSTLVYEYPVPDNGDPYYPVPQPQNAALYKKYEALADATPGVHFAGRLGTYRYYNMDQVVAQALALHARIAGQTRSEALGKTA